VYPSFGFGDSGYGVVQIFNWRHDCTLWQTLTKREKIEVALKNLQELYPEVDIASEYAGGVPGTKEYADAAYEASYNVSLYKPGQMVEHFPTLARPQGNIYFAGAHLSSTLVWIVGALESAKRMVEVLGKKYEIKSIDFI